MYNQTIHFVDDSDDIGLIVGTVLGSVATILLIILAVYMFIRYQTGSSICKRKPDINKHKIVGPKLGNIQRESKMGMLMIMHEYAIGKHSLQYDSLIHT